MRERDRDALSNEILYTIKFSSGAEILSLKVKAHVCPVASLFHAQTDCCRSLRSRFSEFHIQ